MSGKRPYRIFLLSCITLLVASLCSATSIYENFDNPALLENGWTETGGNSATPGYNYSTSKPGGCCITPGYIDAKDNNAGGTPAVLKIYAPLALFPQTAGFADLSSFESTLNGGSEYFIRFALQQLSNQGNKLLTGNTGKIDITGSNGITIQANLYNFAACPTCFNLPTGWNLPTNNSLISFDIFSRTAAPVTATAFDLNQYYQTISSITAFAIEVELHGDGSDAVGFDSFSIDNVPEPSYSVALLAAGVIGVFYKRRQSKVS